MNKNVQFFIIFFMMSFSLQSSEQPSDLSGRSHLKAKTDRPSKSSDRPLTFTESVFVGGSGGILEVAAVGQMLTYGMNQRIDKKPFNIRHSYRGVVAHAGLIMPITATYKVVQTQGTQSLQARQDEPLTDGQKVGVSGLAGAFAAVIDTPSNAIQKFLQQEGNAGKKIVQVCKELGSSGLRRGYAANAIMKESPFATALQVVAPKATEFVQEYIDNKLAATVIGSASTGVVTAVITQPGAVVRNKMQADLAQVTYTSTVQTICKICKEQGPKALFDGGSLRVARIAIAIPFYVIYGAALEEWIKK